MSGRHKQGMLVVHPLTGAAVGYVSQQKEWRRYTSDVERVILLSGIPVFNTLPINCVMVNVNFDIDEFGHALIKNAPFLLLGINKIDNLWPAFLFLSKLIFCS